MRLMGECGVCQEASRNVASFACVMERKNFMIWNAFQAYRSAFRTRAFVFNGQLLMGENWKESEIEAELLGFQLQRKLGKLFRFIYGDLKFIKDLLVDATLF